MRLPYRITIGEFLKSGPATYDDIVKGTGFKRRAVHHCVSIGLMAGYFRRTDDDRSKFENGVAQPDTKPRAEVGGLSQDARIVLYQLSHGRLSTREIVDLLDMARRAAEDVILRLRMSGLVVSSGRRYALTADGHKRIVELDQEAV